MEGELDNLLEIVRKAIQFCIDSEAEEVMTNIKLRTDRQEECPWIFEEIEEDEN